jgi:hypothetical protein
MKTITLGPLGVFLLSELAASEKELTDRNANAEGGQNPRHSETREAQMNDAEYFFKS